MKKWQRNRNYRKIRNADGTVSNIIIVDGQKVEVTDEIYKAYAKMDRQERYQEEQQKEIPHVSLEKLCEADVPIDLYATVHLPSAEDVVIADETEMEYRRLVVQLPQMLSRLTEEEQALIQAIFFDGISVREYARKSGVTLRAIQKRRDRILKKLKGFLKNIHPQG